MTSSSKKAADEGWKKLLVDKRKNPRRIDNGAPSVKPTPIENYLEMIYERDESLLVTNHFLC